MLYTKKEATQWLGMTVFEMWIHTLSILLFTILVALKVEQVWDVSWWTVFIPLFTGVGMIAYFSVIVFIRLFLEHDFKTAGVKVLWSALLLTLTFLFEYLLCQKLATEGTPQGHYSQVMSPLFVLPIVLGIRACVSSN
ncbi:transmembrane protein 203-like [Apostichopus japonicus]|uniref:transmembrane protein 203-like n=1 Tax=Stichopus japonicus TaxID=307972 RepID=UPI003AB20D54